VSDAPVAGATGEAPQEVHVERLQLRVAGLDEQAAQTLARLVAEGLAPSLGRVHAGAGLDHLRLELAAGTQAHAAGEDPELLARRIVEQLGRMLAREPGLGPSGEGATL
jgi:hypothetical protein